MLSRLWGRLGMACLVLLPLYAQTSGATAPEVTQFEPVDITDLVNLSSGDFQYAMPVGDVPGAPGGTFPLSLNYKAGIRLAQEASWVGLGWNLQPGSISRAVRAYPDDYLAAPIATTEITRSTYSYSVGIGYEGATIGANWDNHGGFGGQVGYSLGDEENPGPSIGLSYGVDGRGNTSWSASYSAGFQGYKTGYSASVGNHGGSVSGTGVSLSTGGNVGFQGANIRRPNQPYSPYITRQSGGTASLLGLSLGAYKSRAYRRSFSHAYGYLHLDRVGRDMPAAYAPQLAGPGKNTVLASEVAALGGNALGELDALLNISDLDRTYTDVNGNSISLDTYYQDYQGSYITPYQDDDNRDALNQAKAYSADYLTGSFDIYSVAAPGLSGIAKPVQQKRGLLLPPENTTTPVSNTGFFQFHPYRNLMRAMAEGRLANWPGAIEAYFREDDWQSFGDQDFAGIGEDNMVFLNDPALLEDNQTYDFSANFDDHHLKRRRFYRRHHQSQRIRYHLNDLGRIERITVVKNDGVRYVFGVLRDSSGLITAGASPQNYEEERHSRVSENLDPASPENKSVERMTQPYAYAWYLAAVTSPDFSDQAPLGHFGPEDFGDYITFQYGIANPSFSWLNPFPGSGENGDGEPDFNFQGRDRNEGYFSFERSRGSKDIYIPLFAKTRSHMAVFDYSAERTDNRGGFWDDSQTPARVVTRPIYRFRENHFTVIDENLRDQNGNPHPLVASIRTWAGDRVSLDEGHLVLFQAGTAHLIGLTESGQTMPVTLSNGLQPAMRYLGTLPYTHGDLFFVNRCDLLGGAPCSFSSITADVTVTRPNQVNGSVKLDQIRIYERNNQNNALFAATNHQTVDLQTFNHYTQTVLGDGFLRKTEFSYSYELGHMVPNSADGGRLTLTQVQFTGAGTMGNPFRFDYYVDKTSATHPSGYRAAYYQKDPWGFPSPESDRFRSLVSTRTFTDGNLTVPIQANFSLKSIRTPVGTELSMQYEGDRFSRAQDRLAVNATVSPLDPTGESIPMAQGMLYQQADMTALVGTRANPNSYRQIRDALTQMPLDWNRVSNSYPNQVIVFAKGSSIDENCTWIDGTGTCRTPNQDYPSPNIHRFVVPLDVAGSPTMAAAHAGLDELARWLITETTHPQGRVTGLAVWALPGENNLPRAFDPAAATNENLSIGEPGGGIRVAQLKTAPVSWPGNAAEPPSDQVRILRYAYHSSRDGLDSGTIFSDPPAFRFGFGGDQRLINSDAHAYFNMPGSEVVYGEVTVSTHNNAGQALGGRTRYRFMTASEPEIIKPFNNNGPGNAHYSNFQEQIREHHVGDLYWWGAPGAEQQALYNAAHPGITLNHDSNPLFRWKLRRNLEGDLDRTNPFEVAGHNLQNPAGFLLRYDANSTVLNNSTLVGQLREQTTFDGAGRTVNETLYQFRPSYALNGQAPLVFRFSRNPDGQVQANLPLAAYTMEEANRVGYEGPNFPPTRPMALGVHTEQSQGIMIGRADGEGYLYNVGFRTQDEVWNQFLRYRTTVRHHEPLGDRVKVVSVSKEDLAYDYSSGAPSIVETSSVKGDGSPMYRYEWMVPAHELWDPNGEAGMKQQNMLLQKGLILTAESRTRLKDQVNEVWPHPLFGSDVQVQTAVVDHWRKNAFATRPNAWVKDTAMAFSPTRGFNSQGWRIIPEQRQGGFLKDTQYTALDGSIDPDGKWLIKGQNTAWNHYGKVLEYRDRLGNFNSVVYDSSGTYLKASFTNARLDEVYYDDFEHYSNDPENTYPPTKLRPGVMVLSQWTGYRGNTVASLRERLSKSYTGAYAAYGRISIAFVPGAGRPAEQAPPTASHYWLRFYARTGNRDGEHVVVVNNQTIPLAARQPTTPDDFLWVTPVDHEWFMVKMKLPVSAFAALQLNTTATNVLIDNLAIYPEPAAGQARSSVAHYDYHPVYRQITAMTDARGRTARYQYNERGELLRVIDPEGNVTREHFRLEYRPSDSTP